MFYEYHTIMISKKQFYAESINNILNKYGSSGWELINIVPVAEASAFRSVSRTEYLIAFFKRPRPQ